MTSKDRKEAQQFISLLKKLNEEEQAGLLLMVQGAKLLSQNKKQRITRRSLP